MSPETKSEKAIRTIPIRLETSHRKNEIIQPYIDEMKSVMRWVCSVLPSYPIYQWSTKSTQLYRHMGREFPKEQRDYYANHYQSAMTKVISSFNSWDSNGRPGKKPTPSRGNFAPLNIGSSTKYINLVNNGGSYGVEIKLKPYSESIWFGIDHSPYSKKYLDRVISEDDEASIGSSELHFTDDGSLYLHLVVTWPVDVYKVTDVDRRMGIDLNIDPMVVSTVVDADGNIEHVDMERGKEFKHHRDVLSKKKQESQRDRNENSILWYKYTDHITNVASRRVVDVATEHAPVVICLEDLTHYRKSAENPIHDWPYAEIQNKIKYKATANGIPVKMINPRYTSITCRKCGVTNKQSRKTRDLFVCCNCEYEVHADVNAAYNIATGGIN